ncbi:MAG: SDR family NAD(P)-dependent oxidoreductase [Collimonas pratensis]|uniref:SDR family NAD(P)-dependent oxidoreductase n=1 Tax=Collimonas pratensis TaxID=279113 RepID=UPI003C75A81B
MHLENEKIQQNQKTSYAGKRVFISGGSQGLGRAIALQLAHDGAHVCVAARGLDALAQTVTEMKQTAGGRNTVLIARNVDVTNPAAVELAAADAVSALAGLDLLICNQGFAHTGPVHELPVNDFKQLIEVNYLGHAYLCRAFAPHFMQQKGGTIVMVSSVLGYLSTYGYAAYSGSKWAIVGFAEGLRQELGLYGVQVKVVYPGTIDTPGLAQENADKPKVVWEIESNNAFNVLRSADEVARRLLIAARGRRFENPIGWDGWFSFLASRHLPWLVRMLNQGDLRKAIKKHTLP